MWSKKLSQIIIILFLSSLFLNYNLFAQRIVTPPKEAEKASPRTNIIFSFNDDIEDWRAYEGTVEHVQEPGQENVGYLLVKYEFKGSGFLKDTFESPEINEDISEYQKIQLYVFIPSSAPSDIKGEIFIKVGPEWKWVSGGWKSLKKGEWTLLSIPISAISKNLRNNEIRTVGVQIGRNNSYKGYAFIDRVEIVPKKTISVKK